jgi:hypothetical protein
LVHTAVALTGLLEIQLYTQAVAAAERDHLASLWQIQIRSDQAAQD